MTCNLTHGLFCLFVLKRACVFYKGGMITFDKTRTSKFC